MVTVENLSRKYKAGDGVFDLSFSVRPGEVLGLLGQNGAGKTTTLRSMVGVLRPDQGRVLVGGFDVALNPVDAKRGLAYVPDDPGFFATLSVWDHLKFTAGVYQVEKFETRAEELLRRFEIWEKRDSFCFELSKGGRQRVALSCAFLHGPRAILLDEPMTGLDPVGLKVLNSLVSEAARGGTSVILSSHLLSYLEEVCTNVLVLKNGRQVLYGALADIRREISVRGDATLEEIFLYATKRDAE